MPRESKGQLKRRLRQERRFGAFVARREELKRQGEPSHDAWRIAAAEFPPLPESSVPEQRAKPPARDFDTESTSRYDDDPQCIDDATELTSPEPGLPSSPP